MATDIVPELLYKIQTDFRWHYDRSKAVKKALAALEHSPINFALAYDYADECGKILSKVLVEDLNENILPDGKMYYNISQRVLEPTLTNNHDLVNSYCRQLESNVYDQLEIGLKPIEPDVDKAKIERIVNAVSNAETLEAAHVQMQEPVQTFVLQVVDEFIQRNAEFQNKAGLKVLVSREYDDIGLRYRTQDCEWCLSRVGTNVPFERALKNGMFARHQGCKCIITYTTDKETTRSTGKYSGWQRV